MFDPEAVLFYDRQGDPIVDGLATTGMTVKTYTIIVPGDADGNGYVDAKDVVKGIELCLQDESASPEAHSLDTDHALDWSVLVEFSRSLEGNPF